MYIHFLEFTSKMLFISQDKCQTLSIINNDRMTLIVRLDRTENRKKINLYETLGKGEKLLKNGGTKFVGILISDT